jgi:tRNA(Ile)-lysidine synthase
MPGIDEAVLDAVRSTDLVQPGRPLVVLLSGGRDSTCLLDVAHRIAGAADVEALHVNYGLRESADGDERHCSELCRGLDLTLHVERAQPPRRGNVQAWARDVRYGAATRRALAVGGDVAAGHTATDQAETILYRLASSPGRRALLGMSPRSGRLVRPLLGVSRAQTAEYCRARGLSWVEDESNADPAYARARVREDLVPALRALHPAAEENVIRTAALLRDEGEVLDYLVDGVLDGRDSVSVSHLQLLPAALCRLVVRRLAERAAGAPVPQAAARLDEILALAPDGGSAALDIGTGTRATVAEGVLSFGPTPPLAPPVSAP